MKVNAGVSKETTNGVSRSMELYPIDPSKTGGSSGEGGLSAYEIAVKNGFVGTEQEWLDSLNGTYLKMDTPNKRAFLTDVFVEDELERTYTNMGKNKVMLAINRKGSSFPVKDIIPTFKELVHGVEQIQQENKITYVYDDELEELKKHFGDIIDFEAPYKEIHMYAKINKAAYLTGMASDYSTMYLSQSSGSGTNVNSTFRVYGLNNEIVYESINNTSSFSLAKIQLSGPGFKYKGEEYFKMVFKFTPIEGADEDKWYKEHYFNCSDSDRDFLSLIAVNGYQYGSRLGLKIGFSSSYDAGYRALKFLKLKDVVLDARDIDFENLRVRKVVNESLFHIECSNFLNKEAFRENLLYSSALESSGRGYNINHGIKNLIVPWGEAYKAINDGSRNVINVLDRAYFLSKESIMHFIEQVNHDAIKKSVEIRIRYSDFLNSDDPDAEICINKMTEINQLNPLIKFVI
ncbi:MAG: hypothetical protein ACRCXX_14180 [Cetobacterium sp.]|uniref:hypothetical protein n=1 Tax=Cetobacterium sp. TaxID=2071632 RepID=UPI003F3C8727